MRWVIKIIIDGLVYSKKYEVAKNLGKDMGFEVIDTDIFLKAIAFYLLINGITWYKYNRLMPKFLSRLELRHEWNENNELDIFINKNKVTKTLSLTIIEETVFYYAAFEDVINYLKKYLNKYFLVNNKNQIFVGSKVTCLITKPNVEFFIDATLDIREKLLESEYKKRGDSYLKEDLAQNIFNYDNILKNCENFPVKKTNRHKLVAINSKRSQKETIEYMKEIIKNSFK